MANSRDLLFLRAGNCRHEAGKSEGVLGKPSSVWIGNIFSLVYPVSDQCEDRIILRIGKCEKCIV